MKTRIVSCILLVACLVVLVVVKKTEAAEDWITITSSHLDSVCGEEEDFEIAGALDGSNGWVHLGDETHWFILDLGGNFTITKVRGRSNVENAPPFGLPGDPTDVDIYVSDDKGNWGAAVKDNITTWQDTTSWVEIDTTDKEGQYIKVEIITTEDTALNYLGFGDASTPFTIFDAYGSTEVSVEAAAQMIFIMKD